MRVPERSEDEPIGWFELEDDWDDLEIKLQQCRVAKVNIAVNLTLYMCTMYFKPQTLTLKDIVRH